MSEKLSTNLESEFKKLNCEDENMYSSDCNKFLLKKEIVESDYLEEHEDENTFLYPNLNDKTFNIKIAEKKEFNDTKYDGTIHKSIKEQADALANSDFELQPHQAFVKNFMSFQTPYSSLLLYHGLGTGKTCSAIGVCEDMRDYMKQVGISKRIIIVASENVQDNFRLQLFDERKLKLIDGIWNIRSCTGNKLLKEINPMNMKGMSREKVISQIKGLINSYYIFLGYGQFANYIIKTMNYTDDNSRENYKKGKKGVKPDSKKPGEKTRIQEAKEVKVVLNKRTIKRLRNEFNNRLIVIDEVHNIRKSDDNENKRVAINLELLVESAQNLRLLLLSATPMYNSYKEIVWLLNLMNKNDKRGIINTKDIFDSTGEIKSDEAEDLLIRKATGYVSFVRGENPYTFPYRVYPNVFAKDHTFPKIDYPSYQMNLKKIKHEDKKRILSLYLTKIGNCGDCGECQYCCYKYIINNLRNKDFSITTKKGVTRNMPSFENMESFGYTLLQTPLESLIISYPHPGLKELIKEIPKERYLEQYSPSFAELPEEKKLEENKTQEDASEKPGFVEEKESEESEESEEQQENKRTISSVEIGGSDREEPRNAYIESSSLTGKNGLDRMMTFVERNSPPIKGQYEYKKQTLDTYGRIFSQEIVGKYSSKIKSILDNIYNPETNIIGEGIILIYSQYIDSGIIPMALALEELGFTRYGQNTKPLFKTPPVPVVDARTMKPPINKKDFRPARYALITGDPKISPDNDYEVKGLTGEDNKEGNKVKVVLISKAGSEGIDLKFIRQVHILEPWYNMNRIEQIIGRAVRNFSHKDLPFEKRNVEIFMYGTILEDNKEESADLYVYRVAEYKAVQIGKVTRVLKETAVDCIINHDQTNFTQEIINEQLKEEITQQLSNGEIIHDFKVGDAPFSPSCDYMATCNYDCRPDKKIDFDNLNEDTYNESFIIMNSEKILQRIRMLMKESFFYTKDNLFKAIRATKEYPYIQIYSALTQLIEDNNEFIVDKYGRNGHLVNIGEYYLFQPIELKDHNASIFDRSVPIDYKHTMIDIEVNKNIAKTNLHEDYHEDTENSKGQLLLEKLKEIYQSVVESKEKEEIFKDSPDEWYKHCGIVMNLLIKDMPEIESHIYELLVDHIIELLLYDEKLALMNYLYSLDGNIQANTFEWLAKQYFIKRTIITKNFKAFILYKLDKRMVMILNDSNIWVEAEHEDQREIASAKETKELLTFNPNNYNKMVGFIGYEKNNKYLIFKTKNITLKRDTGARCDEAGKNNTMEQINEILGIPRYTSESIKAKKATKTENARNAISRLELCIIQELILRYFNNIRQNGKKWFLTPEMVLYFKLYTVNK